MSTWLLLFTMITSPETCGPVSGDQISGSDLYHQIPSLGAVPKDAIIGYSPAPGSRRVLRFAELSRIGKRYGIAVAPDAEACFEWKMQPVTEEQIRSAILESLPVPGARVEIMERNKGLAPVGRLEFPRSGLSVSSGIDPETPLMWRGYVLYGNSRRFSIWARVRISATMTRVVAVQPLAAGETVQAAQVRSETYDDFPLRNDIARNLDEVIGRVPRRPVRAGLPIFRTDLDKPFQVQRGDTVDVTAVAGAAQLELDAIAQSSGRKGDVISFKNPQSGKTFRARIEGPDKAVVLAGPGGPLARAQ